MSFSMPAGLPGQEPDFLQYMVFDHAELSERLDQDRDLLREVLSAFLIDLPGLIDTLNSALQSKDIELIRCAAHKLKGAVSNVSFQQLTELSRQIEFAAHNGDAECIEYLSQYLAQAVSDARGQIFHYTGSEQK